MAEPQAADGVFVQAAEVERAAALERARNGRVVFARRVLQVLRDAPLRREPDDEAEPLRGRP